MRSNPTFESHPRDSLGNVTPTGHSLVEEVRSNFERAERVIEGWKELYEKSEAERKALCAKVSALAAPAEDADDDDDVDDSDDSDGAE